MKNSVRFIIFLVFLLISSPKVYANSEYVLPYPGTMPGNKLYSVIEIKNSLEQYWHFGNFAQFLYHRQQADKYLVEAKTLFEYKQYLLAYQALKRSDEHFTKLPIYLEKAKKEKKDITEKKQILKEMAQKHIEILTSISENTPESFTWTPEKANATELQLRDDIAKAIDIRSMCL